jgi:thiamine biosynthesis lipoprotein
MSTPDSDNPLKLQKRAWFYLSVLIVFGVSVFALLFIKKPTPYTTKDVIVMGTHMRMCLGTSKNPYTLFDAMIREVKRIEGKFSFRDKSSIISEINNNGDSWTFVDEETRFILERSYELALITNGAFDPALGSLNMLWGFDHIDQEDFSFRVPNDKEIEDALRSSGYENLEISEDSVRIRNGALLDLGGIVKGYAIDRCVQIAKELDTDATGYVDIGGDIGIIGAKFGGSDWVIGVQHPREEGVEKAISTVFMKTGGIATSGDYQRYFIIEGIRYHHIIDPETGKPATGTVSSSVIASNSMDSDALATAAFVLGSDYAVQMLPRLGGQVFLLDDTLTCFSSAGWEIFTKNNP